MDAHMSRALDRQEQFDRRRHARGDRRLGCANGPASDFDLGSDRHTVIALDARQASSA
jgi:hypothetical protein